MFMKLTIDFDIKEPAYRILDKIGMLNGVKEVKVDSITEDER